MTDQIDVKFGAQTGPFNAGVDQAKAKLGEIADSADSLKGELENLAGAFAAVFAVDRLAEFASTMAGIGQQMERMSAMTGLPVAQVEDFQDKIKVLGGDAESAGMSLMRLERNISEAASNAGGPAADAFHRLGVSQESLARGDVSEILDQMAKKMADSADGANKLGAMMQVAGRGGMQLIEMLDQGTVGLDEVKAALDSTGPGLAGLAGRFEQSAQGIALMDIAADRLKGRFYSELEPAFDAIVAGMTNWDAQTNKNIGTNSSLTEGIHFLGLILDAAAVVVMTLATGFEQFYDVAAGAVKGIVASVEGMGQALIDIATGKPLQAWDDFWNKQKAGGAAMAQGIKEASEAGQQFIGNFNHMGDVYQGLADVGTGAGGGSKGTKKIKPPKPTDSGKDDSGTQRSLYAEKYDVQKEYDELAVQSGQMTHAQELADLQAALSQEEAAVKSSFDQQMAAYTGDAAGYQKLIDQKQIADEKFQIEHMKLTQQATEYDSKEWTSAIGVITKTFDQMTTGILQGNRLR